MNTSCKSARSASLANSTVFYDGTYLSAAQKKRVFASFVRLLESGFEVKHFSKALYEHLSLHCGFIAHFNRETFFAVRFASPEGRAQTLATLASRGGSKWRFVDENSSFTADLSRAIALFVDSSTDALVSGIRRDETASIDRQIAALLARRDVLRGLGKLDDSPVVDAACG